jgi:hypothetical protein
MSALNVWTSSARIGWLLNLVSFAYNTWGGSSYTFIPAQKDVEFLWSQVYTIQLRTCFPVHLQQPHIYNSKDLTLRGGFLCKKSSQLYCAINHHTVLFIPGLVAFLILIANSDSCLYVYQILLPKVDWVDRYFDMSTLRLGP